MTPAQLFHGSGFYTPELKPGFQRSGTLVRWDDTEDNTFLYATTDRETAIVLGFASAIEKKYGLDRFQHNGTELVVQCPRQPHGYRVGEAQFAEVELWLYTISPHTKDRWERNKNQHNGLKTEFKTKATVTPSGIESIRVADWLRGYTIVL